MEYWVLPDPILPLLHYSTTPSLRPSHVHSPVHVQHLAGDVGAVDAEEADGGGDFARGAEALQRDAADDLLADLAGDRGDHVRFCEARRDAVDGDVVAGELQRQRAGEA